MKHQALIQSAATSLLATLLFSAATSASSHMAGDLPGKEKCYGIAKAGQNACANLTATHDCAGQAKLDNDKTEWVYVATGTCKKLKGLSETEAKKALKKVSKKLDPKSKKESSTQALNSQSDRIPTRDF